MIQCSLDVLWQLPINVDDLEDSELAIGRKVMDLKNRHVSKEIRDKSAKLVDKWMQLVMGTETDFKKIPTEHIPHNYIPKQYKKANAFEEKISPNSIRNYWAQPPKKAVFAFNKIPTSSN